MFSRRQNLVIGLTTFNTEMLKISVPAVAAVAQRGTTLIIHNDNPNARIRRRDIRKMGYRGRLNIINSDKSVGLRAARLRILDAVPRSARWIIYVNDDDVLTDATIVPTRGTDFAIIQNAAAVIRRISDLMRAGTNPKSIAPDGQNVILVRPHVGLAGTPVRVDIMRGAADIMRRVTNDLDAIDAAMEYRPPVDEMMWMALCAYAHNLDADMAPIFMNRMNYVINRIDTDAEKYGRRGVTQSRAQRFAAAAMAQYTQIINDAITAQSNANAAAADAAK